MAYDLGDFLEDVLDFDNELIKPDSVVIEGGDKIETFTVELPDDLFDDKPVKRATLTLSLVCGRRLRLARMCGQ